MSVAGGRAQRPSARASSAVLYTRLARIAAFFAAVHRPRIRSPERWITASNSSTAAGSSTPAAGSQWTSPASGERRTRRTTVCPSALSAADTALPISPLAAEMSVRIYSIVTCSPSFAASALR